MALSKVQKDKPSFFSTILENAYVFNKAFTTSTYSKSAFNSIFNGKYSLEDNLFEFSLDIDVEESFVLNYIMDKGMNLFGESIFNFVTKDVEKKSNIFSIPRKYREGSKKYETNTITEKFWNYFDFLAHNNECDNFGYVHFFEGHSPYICSKHSQPVSVYWICTTDLSLTPNVKAENIMSQIDECMVYMDEQLNYYYDFFPENTSKIMIGDHGSLHGEHDGLGASLTFYEEMINILCIADVPFYEKTRSDNLFSFKDFGNLLLDIVNKSPMGNYKRDFVLVQREPVYNRKVFTAYEENKKFYKAFKVIRGENDKFVLYEDGTEEYFLLPDEANNEIHNQKFADRIQYMRENVGSKTFPDFYKTEKFTWLH